MNIQALLNQGFNLLKNSPSPTAMLDSEILLSKVLKKNREYLILNYKENLPKESIELFYNLLERRKKSEPIAYIVKKKEFWKQTFYIDQSVLIPRPDTEVLVQETLKLFGKNFNLRILDIGTGSGCILLSLLKERRNFIGTGIDISKKAINVARFNAKLHQLGNRVKFFNSDVDKFLFGKYDLIVSNPPYIKNNNIKYLEKDVFDYEPEVALDGGKTGFSKISKVVCRASSLIKKNGKLILEIGYDQKSKVIEILKKNRFYINKIAKDYANKDRCIISTKL